jgi:uncharacterized damage-inducible protein DinB
MPGSDPKADLHRYLQEARDAMLWKLEGLSEYDVRRPLVPTATNLLGLVKHLTHVEFVYFGATFGRPSAEKMDWSPEDPLSDMYAAAGESRAYITGLYKQAWAHSDVTIEALSLDAPGRVPHWRGERGAVTLHRIMVHVIAESHRHAGHADIVRELIDGAAGLQRDRDNLPSEGADWWLEQRNRVERAAREAATDG